MSVVIHTPDVVGVRMAGPGIRAWHLAREIGRHVPAILIAKVDGSPGPDVPILQHGSREARAAMRDANVLVGQPARAFRKRRPGQKIVYDLFDPTVLELRELYGNAPSLRQRIHMAAEWWRLSEALMRADLLLCAAPAQREFYATLQSGEADWLEVPFGVDPAETGGCEKPRDDIVVWGGGVWEWLDPATAIDAVVQLNRDGVAAKLLFLGTSRPNAGRIDRRRQGRFEELLVRGGRYVSANEGWVPYRERLSWLRAGKVAIMLHRRTAEARYSIRTRLFDAIAAGVPLVATSGGFAADLIEQEGLGLVVPPDDVPAVAGAIRRLLKDDVFHSTCVQNLERIQPRFTWDAVAAPLVRSILQWQT